jgi:hypothetical protein
MKYAGLFPKFKDQYRELVPAGEKLMYFEANDDEDALSKAKETVKNLNAEQRQKGEYERYSLSWVGKVIDAAPLTSDGWIDKETANEFTKKTSK